MWTYDPTDLDKSTASGRLNAVRYLVGDTDTSDQQVQDEEISFALSESNDNIYRAAAYVADTLATKYARLVTTELDGQLTMEYSDISQAYRKLADDLKDQARQFSGALGVAGGGLKVPNKFERYQFDNPSCVEDYRLWR